MRPQLLLASIAWFATSTLAVFEDDAFNVDYHHQLVGLPQQHTSFFHPVRPGSGAVLYTLSDKLVLGAISPKDGSVLWRQLLKAKSNTTNGFLRAGEGQDIVVSAVDGQVAGWSASNGRMAWSHDIGDSSVRDLEILELRDGKETDGGKDAVVLFGDKHPIVRRLDGNTGQVKWEFADSSGDLPYQISASATTIYLMSLHTTILNGLKIKCASLNPVTGHKDDQYTLSSDSDLSSAESIIFVGANSASPIIAWTDNSYSVLKINIIGNKNVASFNINPHGAESIERVVLHAPHHINSVSHFLVHYQTAKHHWAEVYHIDLRSHTVSKAYDLPRLAGKGVFSTSTSDANVYFTRITEDEVIVVSSTSHGALGRWPIARHEISGTSERPSHVHAVSEVAARSGALTSVRSAVLSSTGDWQLILNGESQWRRLEALAGTTTAAWAELHEEAALAHELEVEGHSNVLAAYTHRLRRHLQDLRKLPGWLQNLPKRLLGSYGGSKTAAEQDALEHDSFGFHKLVIVATEHGRLIALNAGSSGKVVWNIQAFNLAPGTKWRDAELHITEGLLTVQDPVSGETASFETLTGKRASHSAAPGSGSAASTKISYDLVGGELRGIVADWSNASPVWDFKPSKGERIQALTARPTEDPVASIGKVLGDRRVLYKYLNPNLVLVTTVSDSARSLSVYLLDSVSGSVLYSATHSDIDVTRTISSTVSENWLAYSFTLDSSSVSTSQGHELVVAELFESAIPNDRGPLEASSNYSSMQPSYAGGDGAKPYVVAQSYHIPEEVSHMAVTQTRQGITSRQLLVVLAESSSIVGIPRMFIDPRRPIGRDPTATEAAEGLIRYSPVIELDPKWYLTHKREVIGIKKIITSPALLESTSLVFAYGLDVFGTRISPSFSFDVLGKDFNKLQMLATVAALGIGTFIVAPLVRRKQINARWQL
ncbi:hypothetical protein BJ546DRAFT_833761 [Cryomyces antarcticus]